MTQASEICRRAVIHGRVQGVFFRDSVRERAEAAGLTGSVRNCPDGSVEVVLQGPPTAVEQVIEFCHHGPDRARVQRVQVSECTPQARRGFTVR